MNQKKKYIICMVLCAILLSVCIWATTLTGAFFALAYETNGGFYEDTAQVFALFMTALVGVIVSVVLLIVCIIKMAKLKKKASTALNEESEQSEEQSAEESVAE